MEFHLGVFSDEKLLSNLFDIGASNQGRPFCIRGKQFSNNPWLLNNKGRLLGNKVPLLKNKAGLFCIVFI